jgi:hypothetical protein
VPSLRANSLLNPASIVAGLLLSAVATASTLPVRLEPVQDKAPLAKPDSVEAKVQEPAQANNRRMRAALLRRSAEATQSVDQARPELTLEMIRTLPRDSAARLENFQYQRRDPVNVEIERRTPSPMYLPEPSIVVFRDELDSLRWQYRLRRLVAGMDSRIPVVIPLAEYSQIRLQRALRSTWEAMTWIYTGGPQRPLGLGDVFGKVTNIEIPIPKNPLFSIFGPNIIKVQINGGIDIHAAFRNTTSDLVTNSVLGQSRNEPDFKQEVQVSVKGEIGDKLKIDADWNTQRTFEYENQLHVRYQGYEDEVVQSVEAGNVSLSTPASFISSSQALFGIKAGFLLGPMKLTTVASQKKGQVKELTVSSGGNRTPFERRLTDYSQDHYFVDSSYIGLYEDIYNTLPAIIDPNKQIKEIEVWFSRLGEPKPGDRSVVAFVNSDAINTQAKREAARTQEGYLPDPGVIELGSYYKADLNVDYTLNANAGILTLARSLQKGQSVAVAYETAREIAPQNPEPEIVGTFGSRDTTKNTKLALKLVRAKDLDPGMRAAWRLQLKNRYPLGGRGVTKDGVEFNIEYEPVLGQTPISNLTDQQVHILRFFGLDKYIGESGGNDQKFDYIRGITIDESRAEVIFPTVEPFSRSSMRKFLEPILGQSLAIAAADSFGFDKLYDTTTTGAAGNPKNKFFFRGNITPAFTSTYNLGFNIVPGSVRVLVDGIAAKPNEDYTVDEISGQVQIRNTNFLLPGKRLEIKYEANDLFQIASKSLLAARGDIDVGKNSSLGFTIMSLNQQSLSDKVRLGEEPTNNTIMGIDGGTSLTMDWLTRALNWIPGLKSTISSTLQFRGEAAWMLPDPNTRKSPINQDGGAGVAYIDDFEGARRTLPLGENFAQWRDASPPFYVKGLDPLLIQDTSIAINTPGLISDAQKINFKSRAAWFNIPNEVAETEIWPKKSVDRNSPFVTVMDIHLKPTKRGAYNYSPNLDSTVISHPTKTWAGFQRVLATQTTNLVDENYNFVELWVNVLASGNPSGSPQKTMLNVDLGFISEDIIPNGAYNTESGSQGGIRTTTLRQGEDRGLDSLTNEQERRRFANFIAQPGLSPEVRTELEADPSGDDFARQPTNIGYADPNNVEGFDKVNGTDGNAVNEAFITPDTEDKNGNDVLDRINSYFEYEIPLDTTDARFKRYVVGGQNGWYQLRLPLNEYTRTIGTPSLTSVEGIRIWMTGATTDALLQLAEMNLVGNQWEEVVRNDPNFKVSVVNFEDNPQYTIPPGVNRQLDRTRPDQQIYGNEQSLNLILKDLADGQSKQAIKRFTIAPLNLFNYRALKMFVHGETGEQIQHDRMNFTDINNYDAEVFLRFGADSTNYYEYRAPIHPGWDLNDITIRFQDLTAVKLLRDSSTAPVVRIPIADGPPGATYSVRGEPSLRSIRQIVVGIENPVGTGVATIPSAEVWANELRLTDVDNTKGSAYRFDASLKLADFASLSVTLSNRDPYFHSLEERFGSLTNGRAWSAAANIAVEKLFPASWQGTSLGLAYSHSETMQDPRYLPGTDILVDEAVRRVEADTSTTRVRRNPESIRTASQDLTVNESYGMPSIKLVLPINFWLISETINRMTFGYTYSEARSRNPATEFANSWSWNASWGYSLPLSPKMFLQPFGIFPDLFPFSLVQDLKLFFAPRQLSFGMTLARSQSQSKSRTQPVPNAVVRDLTGSRSFSFNWQIVENGLLNLGTDYQVSVQSSLRHLETDQFGNQRSMQDILSDIFFSDRIVSYGKDLSYNQTLSFSTRPVVPKLLSLDKILTPTLRYSSGYTWQNNPQAGDLGKSAGWNSNLNFSLDVNLKSASDAIWSSNRLVPVITDTAMIQKSSLTLDNISRLFIKTPIFDFDRVTISFSQTNTSQNNGVLGGNGFANIFARVPFLQSSLVENGPSLFYQLGLSSDPHGEVELRTKDTFPFISGYTIPGPRAVGQLADVYSQRNEAKLSTRRPLWEGASLDLNWSVGWQYNENTAFQFDTLGNRKINSRAVAGSTERSFFTMPSVFIFKFLKTGIDEVGKRFERLKADRDGRTDDTKLSQAFVEGLEGLPILSKLLGELAPRANWSIRWDGLEKFVLFRSFASHVTLDHAYTSTYRRRWRISAQGNEVTEGQGISYGFTPLIGLSVTFKELFKGNFTGTFRFGSTTAYDLTPVSQQISESFTNDITFSSSFNRQGFEIPLFGLSLKNDLDISLSYTYAKNSRRLYDFKPVNFNAEGQALDGSNRTVIEPRLRYTLSARVTASGYYKYTKIAPDEGGSKIPGQTINEGGIDVHIAIQ